jgi:hypothetical protein
LIDNAATGHLELFDLDNDAGEQNNVAGSRSEIVSELSRRIETFKARNRAPERSKETKKLEPEEIEHLRALGYLGGN